LRSNKKLSFIEQVVYAILSDARKGALNVNRVYARIPSDALIEKDQVYKALLSLVNKKKATQPAKGQFKAITYGNLLKGTAVVNKRGEWMLEDEKGDWTRLPGRYTENLLPGDIIEISYSQRGKRLDLQDLNITQRAQPLITGTLDVFEGSAYLLAPESGLPDIEIKEEISEEFDGHKAKVKVLNYPKNGRYPIGEIQEVFGLPGEHETEMHAIVSEFGFSMHFPKNVETAAKNINEEITLHDYREDFRNITTFTIDPVDAKDFDDALSIHELKNRNIEIGVHIADVDHYVSMGSDIDKEAAERATSVYLVDRTISMLPEKLSNDLCSLKPHVDRYSFSVVLVFNSEYELIDHRISKGVIHSDHRFSYESAQENLISESGEYFEELKKLNNIAEHHEKIRYDNGALKFESKELKFELDDQNLPTKVIEKTRFETHKLIETFMLLANRVIAEYVLKKNTPPPPFIYRTHDEPPADKLIEFAKFCKLMGYPIHIDNEKVLRKSFNSLLERTNGKPEQELLQQMSIRTMAKAVYTGQKTSHFGLAFPFYTHFTSPIRRYPDLLAHRMLFKYLQSDFATKPYTSEEIEAIAKHSSNREQQASDAERASVKYKLTELMQQYEGQLFEAKVSGITEWGIYATISEFHAEGLIRLRDIRFDHFQFIESERKVKGRKSKRTYQMGDYLHVKVKKANTENRTIDLILVE
jgi:ribonuclease R